MEISGKIGSQRHLVAIRDSFIAMMPITMAGSVILLTFLVQLFWFFGLHRHNVLAPVMAGLVSLFNLLISFLIWLPFVISANKVKAD
ncbi:MAG TPA: hypothetical protein K8V19_07780 [Globicatella sulfidifaciens]|nr:hypothetical protein [Globicatella sulfidifaciens]